MQGGVLRLQELVELLLLVMRWWVLGIVVIIVWDRIFSLRVVLNHWLKMLLLLTGLIVLLLILLMVWFYLAMLTA